MNKVYWTMKDGEKIDIDEMDINHLRNTLKMIIREAEKEKKRVERQNKLLWDDLHKFKLNGDIAQMTMDGPADEQEYDDFINEQHEDL